MKKIRECKSSHKRTKRTQRYECDACKRAGERETLACIVAWLRDKGMNQHSIVADEFADAIERGDWKESPLLRRGAAITTHNKP